MISLYGPFPLTAATVFSETVDQAATNLRVTNDSPFDVWVVFQPSRPTVPSNGQSAGAFNQVCQAWSSQVFPVPPAAANSSFDGTVWFLPMGGGSLASSGAASGRAQMYLTTGENGDNLGTNHAVSRQADMTSQPRVVTIPSEPHFSQPQEVSITATGTPVQVTPTLYGGGPLVGGQPMTAYTYGLTIALRQTAWADVEIGIAEITSGSISLTHLVTAIRLRAGHGSLPLYPPSPLATHFTPAAGVSPITYYVKVTNAFPSVGSSVGCLVAMDIRADMDQSGQLPPPAIGNGAATIAGTIY